MSKQKNQSSLIKPWTISSCPGPHHICPKIWKNKFIEHEIHCKCNCHQKNNIELRYSAKLANAKKEVEI